MYLFSEKLLEKISKNISFVIKIGNLKNKVKISVFLVMKDL